MVHHRRIHVRPDGRRLLQVGVDPRQLDGRHRGVYGRQRAPAEGGQWRQIQLPGQPDQYVTYIVRVLLNNYIMTDLIEQK